MTDVLDLFEVRLQQLEISIDERPVISILRQEEPGMIGCSHFWGSFHGLSPSFLVFVLGIRIVGVDFEAEN